MPNLRVALLATAAAAFRSTSHRLCSHTLQPACARSSSTSSQKHYGKLESLLKRLAPLALAGATLTLTSNPAQALTLFSDYYAPSNWTTYSGGGFVAGYEPDYVKLIAPNLGSVAPPELGYPGGTSLDFTIVAPDSGTVSFGWYYTTPIDNNYNHFDSMYTDFGYLLNGDYTQITSIYSSGSSQSGDTFFNVVKGDTFGFRLNSSNYPNFNSDPGGAGYVEINDFNGPAAEVPVPLPLLGAALPFGFCRRLRSRSKRLRHGASSRLAS